MPCDKENLLNQYEYFVVLRYIPKCVQFLKPDWSLRCRGRWQNIKKDLNSS